MNRSKKYTYISYINLKRLSLIKDIEILIKCQFPRRLLTVIALMTMRAVVLVKIWRIFMIVILNKKHRQ